MKFTSQDILMKNEQEEISLKELFEKFKTWIQFLKSKILILVAFGIFGAAIGFLYAYYKKPKYTATLSFALEDEKSGNSGLVGAMGLASSLGIDLGTSAGGAFSGANLMELMKSRFLVERALLCPIKVDNKVKTLATYYLEFNELNKEWSENLLLKDLKFPINSNRQNFTLQQDSVLGRIYESITGENGILSVYQKDKKISIINIDVTTQSELFSKIFAENLAKEVSEFYVATKSKKARMNVEILQHQADSIRYELNEAITGVATANDNVYNLNSALNIRRTPSLKRQVDVQANTAILTQLVTNLEMAKVTLLKETPLIQVIDKPILPLKKQKVGKLKSLVLGGMLMVIFSSFYLIGKRLLAGSRNIN